MTHNQTLSGKPTMPSARSAQVYGNVRPMDTTFAKYRALNDRRPSDEPSPILGAVIASGLLGFLIVGLTAAAIMIGV